MLTTLMLAISGFIAIIHHYRGSFIDPHFTQNLLWRGRLQFVWQNLCVGVAFSDTITIIIIMWWHLMWADNERSRFVSFIILFGRTSLLSRRHAPIRRAIIYSRLYTLSIIAQINQRTIRSFLSALDLGLRNTVVESWWFIDWFIHQWINRWIKLFFEANRKIFAISFRLETKKYY